MESGVEYKTLSVARILHRNHCLQFYDIKPLSTRNHHSKSVEFEPNSYRFVNIVENVPQFSNSYRFFTGGVNHKHASAESGIRLSNTTEKLKFHSASPREISNFSVVFEPNSTLCRRMFILQFSPFQIIFSNFLFLFHSTCTSTCRPCKWNCYRLKKTSFFDPGTKQNIS